MSAYQTAARWVATVIDATPSANTLLGNAIYIGLAPKGSGYPLATVQLYVEPVDTNYNRGRALTQVELMVRFWVSAPAAAMPDTDAAEAAYADVDALLHGRAQVVTGLGRIISCRRVRELHTIEHRETETVAGLGGRYIIEVG